MKDKSKGVELKDSTVVLNRDAIMTTGGELNHEKIFQKLALEIDFCNYW